MEAIKAKLAEFYNICKEECYGIRELSPSAMAKIKTMYGYQIKGSTFYSDYNLIFYDFTDAQFFANILPKGCVLAQLTAPEFGTHLIIVRYASDQVLSSILDQN